MEKENMRREFLDFQKYTRKGLENLFKEMEELLQAMEEVGDVSDLLKLHDELQKKIERQEDECRKQCAIVVNAAEKEWMAILDKERLIWKHEKEFLEREIQYLKEQKE